MLVLGLTLALRYRGKKVIRNLIRWEALRFPCFDELSSESLLNLGDYMSKHVCPFCNSNISTTRMCCDSFKALRESALEGIKRAPLQDALFGVPLKVNPTPYAQDELLPFDEHFQLPREGTPAWGSMRRVVKAWQRNVPFVVTGGMGRSKDAVLGLLSNITNRPTLLISCARSTDIEGFLYTLGFNAEGTTYTYGALWKALTEGHPRTGEPMVIVLTDFDRMSPEQLERFRKILDTTAGRINAPDGRIVPILKGTLICATANSVGSGAEGYVCEIIDESMKDRFARFIEAEAMDCIDRSRICCERYGAPAEWVEPIANCLSSLESSIAKEALESFNDFSFRATSAWIESAMQERDLGSKQPLRDSLFDILDKREAEVKQKIENLFDPHLPRA